MHFVVIQQTDEINIIVIKGFLWAQFICQHLLLSEIVGDAERLAFLCTYSGIWSSLIFGAERSTRTETS